MIQSVSPCRHLPLQVLGEKSALTTQFFDGPKKVIDGLVCQAFSCLKGRTDDSSDSLNFQAETGSPLGLLVNF